MGRRIGLIVLGLAALVAGVVVVLSDDSVGTGAPTPPAVAQPAATPAVSASPQEQEPEPAEPGSVEPESAEPSPSDEPEVVVRVEDYLEAEPVALDAKATDEDELVVRIREVSLVEGTGTGIGERSGPAVLVEVVVRNRSDEERSLDFVVANLYGPSGTPSPVLAGDPRSAHLTGSLAPGEKVRGTYVFRAPEEVGPVKLTLSHSAKTPAVTFVGQASP